MQESRLFKIVYYLLEKGKSTAPELAEEFEVSIRTIYRDIDALSAAGIPIYASQGKGGGITILEDFVLDKSYLSQEEKEQILMALQGIIAAGGRDSQDLLTKLGGLFQLKTANWIEVDFSDWIHNSPRQDLFTLIKEAIFQKKQILFQYFNSSGEKVKRSAEPIKLVFKSKDWYLYAFCLLKNDFRYFKLTRIQNLEIQKETFIQRHIPAPEIKKQIYNPDTRTVTLKFDPCMAFRVYDEFTEDVTADEQGYLYVQTKLPANDMLFSYLFTFADHAEIIEPEDIRMQIKLKLENMQKRYNP